MRTTSKFLQILAIILLVIATAFQLLALLGGVLGNAELQKDNPWLVTMWAAALLLLPVAALLSRLLGERGKLPVLTLVVAALGTLLTLLVALALQDAFPPQLNSVGETQGLTPWRLIYRHYSSVAAGALLVVSALLDLIENRQVRIRRDNEEYKSIYDLSGDVLFKDDSTLGLDSFADQQDGPKKKRKRSLRKAAEKAARQAAKES